MVSVMIWSALILVFFGAASGDTVLLEEVGPLQVSSGELIGFVSILDEMHYEMDFTINSWPATGEWGNIFSCGGSAADRYPLVMLQENSQLYVQFRDDASGVKTTSVFMGSALELNVNYRFEMELTETQLIVMLNGEIIAEREKTAHSTYEAVPCYASNSWFSAADVIIENVEISAVGISTVFPAPESTTSSPVAVLLEEVGPLQVNEGQSIGAVPIFDDMHFEMNFTLHSWPSSNWANIFSCGLAAKERYPLMMIHKTRQKLYVQFRDGAASGTGTKTTSPIFGDALELNMEYHVDIDFTQSDLTVMMDGEIVAYRTKSAHSLHDQMPCWASSEWWDYGDVTISNLLITTTSTAEPEAEPAMRSVRASITEPLNVDHESSSNSNAADTSWSTLMMASVGVAAVLVMVIVLAMLKLKLKTQKKADPKPAEKEVVAEVSVSAVPEVTGSEMAEI